MIAIKWKKSLDSRQEEIRHRKNRSSCHPFPGHPAPVLLRIESQPPLPREGEFVWFYHLTGEVNMWLKGRLDRKCKVPHKPWGLGPTFPSTPTHWLQSCWFWGHHWTPTFPKQEDGYLPQKKWLPNTHCNTWRLTEPPESNSTS